ncbi:MAG: hypothetical protein R6V85_20930 [Polyangia bacterium]
MSGDIVVYYFTDASLAGEVSGAVENLRRRGHRVVKGDNADELLFLLQVGRPSAVIYTLGSRENESSASYQMVSRRALGMGVPMILVGPEPPRDGVVLVEPRGRTTARSHVSIHDVGRVVESLAEGGADVAGSAKRSRAAAKGRTMLGMVPGAVRPSRPAPMSPRPKPGKATIRSIPAAGPAPGKESTPAPAPAEVPADGRTIRGAAPPPQAAGSNAEPEVRAAGVGADRHDERLAGSRTAAWKIVVPVLAGVTLLGVGAAVFFATRSAGPPPSPLPDYAGIGPKAPAQEMSAGKKSASAVGAQKAAGGTEPDHLADGEKPPEPVSEKDPAPAPQGGKTVEKRQAGSTAAPEPREKSRGSSGRFTVGELVPFPGHFRGGTAVFWFDESDNPEAFADELKRAAGKRRVRLVGHPTAGEAEDGRAQLGLSRAWAVEKWLGRQGLSMERIDAVRGAPVPDQSDYDGRGFALNRWVDVVVE